MRVATAARSGLLLLGVVAALAPASLSQSQAPGASGFAGVSDGGLLSAVDAEKQKSIYLLYTQTYRSGSSLVLIKGSLYAGITAFSLDKCNLTIGTTIVDRYSGQIGNSQIKETQSSYNYSLALALNPEIAGSLRVVEARPGQLEKDTNPACAAGSLCRIHWLELRASSSVMKMTSMTDAIDGYDGFVKDFDGMVDQFRVPLSSPDAGAELIAKLRSIASGCRQ